MLQSQTARGSAETIAIRSQEWAKLIGKLRWAGLDDEAFRLEKMLGKLPTKARSSIFAGPSETD